MSKNHSAVIQRNSNKNSIQWATNAKCHKIMRAEPAKALAIARKSLYSSEKVCHSQRARLRAPFTLFAVLTSLHSARFQLFKK